MTANCHLNSLVQLIVVCEHTTGTCKSKLYTMLSHVEFIEYSLIVSFLQQPICAI